MSKKEYKKCKIWESEYFLETIKNSSLNSGKCTCNLGFTFNSYKAKLIKQYYTKVVNMRRISNFLSNVQTEIVV